MPHKPKYPMTIEERAKIFMPFDAVKGFKEALEAKRHVTVPKITLGEDKKDELDLIIKSVQPGSMITVIYYDSDEYIKKTGIVAKIDFQMKWIQVVKTKIQLSNIYDIEIISNT